MRALAFIGDIHGEIEPLEELLKVLASERTRHLVFLGDYVNLGRNSRAVIDLLTYQLEQWEGGLTCLAGNHDVTILDYIRSGDIRSFAANGGIQTIASYVGRIERDVHTSFLNSLPSHHVAFFESLKPYFERADIFASHSGIDPRRPYDRSFQTMAGGGSFVALRRKILPKFLVCGHFVQRTFEPYVTDWAACLDTGCGTAGGPLCAMLWPERRIVLTKRSEITVG